jgi:hypothetical protein
MGAAALIAFTLTMCHQAPAPAKWEYRIEAPLDHHFAERMNQLGTEGWEIVALRRVETDEHDFEEFKSEFVPKSGASKEGFEFSVRMKLPKMKYEVVMRRSIISPRWSNP